MLDPCIHLTTHHSYHEATRIV